MMEMTKTERTLRNQVMSHIEDWEEEKGFGPCGAVAALLREQGYGQVAACEYDLHDGAYPFPHFVIVTDTGRIVDISNPFSGGSYVNLEILPDDEMPDLVEDGDIAYWRERLAA